MIEMDERDVTRFINWITSIEQAHLEKLSKDNFFTKLSDGITFLKLMEVIEPGVVDWSRVNLNTENKFKLLANCNFVVSLMQVFNFSEGLVRGRDLVEGKIKSILSLMWLLMREYYLRKHNIQSEEEFQAIANQYLEVVLNQTQSMVLTVSPEQEDIESLRIIFYYGEEGEIFMTFHDESELMCPLLPENFEDLQRVNLPNHPIEPTFRRLQNQSHHLKSQQKQPQRTELPDDSCAKEVSYAQFSKLLASVKVKQSTRDAIPISLMTDISPLFPDSSAKQSTESKPAMAAFGPTDSFEKHRASKAKKLSPCEEDTPIQPDRMKLPPPEPYQHSAKSSKQDSLRPRSAVIATNYNSRDSNKTGRSRRIHIPIVISICPDDIHDAALTENFDMYYNRKKIMIDTSSEKLNLPGGLQLQCKSAASNPRDKHSDAPKAYRSEQLAEEKENHPMNGNYLTPSTSRFDTLADFSKQRSDITYRSRHHIPRSALKPSHQSADPHPVAQASLEPTLTSFVVVPQLRDADPNRIVEGFKKENLTNRRGDSSKPLYPAASQLGMPLTSEAHLKLAKLHKSFLQNLGLQVASPSQATGPPATNRGQLAALERINRASRLEAILLQLPECQTRRSLAEIFNKLADFEKIPADFMRQTFRSLNVSHLSEAHQSLVRAFEGAFFSSRPARDLPPPPAYLTAKMHDPFAASKAPREAEPLPQVWSQLADSEKKKLYREQVKQRILASSEQVDKPLQHSASLAAFVCEQLANNRRPKQS